MGEIVQVALEFAREKHKGQKRIGGDDYISHPIAVREMIKNQGYGEDYQITALFHDLLEDTNATEEDILQYGSEEILVAVKLLTKEKGYDMDEYMTRINGNHMAKMVKLADRVHNLSEAKYAGEKFQRKYIKETEAYFLDLAKGTVFEEDLNIVLDEVRSLVEDICL